MENSNFKLVNRSFNYIFKDELDQLEMANEVCREYHGGQFDPMAYSHKPKRKRIVVTKTAV